MQIDPNTMFHLKLDAAKVSIIFQALGEVPLKLAGPVAAELDKQIKQQLEPQSMDAGKVVPMQNTAAG